MNDLHKRAKECLAGRGWYTNAQRGELIRKLLAENERLRAEVDASQRDAEILRLFVGAAFPISKEIDPRGYTWCQAYLDNALSQAVRQEKSEQLHKSCLC